MAFLDFQLRLSIKNAPKWFFLKILSITYSGLIRLWLFFYKSGIKKEYSIDRKVISIGNITMGGTGKTPMIDWLLDFCRQSGITPAVLSRGYKAKRESELQVLNEKTALNGSHKNFGDEPWMLHKKHPRISFYISPNRIKAAQLAKKDADLILLDDGMQHLKLARDLNIVLIDSSSALGNRQIFPLGPLREPLSGLRRADAIIYTKTNLTPSKTIKNVLKSPPLESVPHFDSSYLPIELSSSISKLSIDISAIKDKKCLLFSGIGNPKAFSMTIKNLGGRVVEHVILGDHEDYGKTSLQKISQILQQRPYDYIICTEKDWVKLNEQSVQLPEFFYLKMKMEIDPEFTDFLKKWLKNQSTPSKIQPE